MAGLDQVLHAVADLGIDARLAQRAQRFLARQAADVFDGTLASVCTDFPDVEVAGQVADDQPIQALLEECRPAQLLVLGLRGRGAFTGLMLGSVSHSAVRGAHCPVAVVR